MKKITLLLTALILLTACQGQTPSAPPPAGDWADAFAAVLTEDGHWAGVTLLDIDGDGIPEAVVWADTVSASGHAGYIYGYENGGCAVWYDSGEPFAKPFDRVYVLRDGDTLRCAAAERDIGIAFSRLSVYELAKTTNDSGQTRIVLYTVSETSLSYRPDHDGGDSLAGEIEAVLLAQQALYEKTLSRLGEEAENPRILNVSLREGGYTAEQMAEKLREWGGLR
ncbi:MAG: hypothetical protein FWG93_06835 [Oscillospiraceae bacterium]|nr:hypothetical protein [Oscillospiraceae bacterium]